MTAIPDTLTEVLLQHLGREPIELGYGGHIHVGQILGIAQDYVWFQEHRSRNGVSLGFAPGPAGLPTAVPITAITSVQARAS